MEGRAALHATRTGCVRSASRCAATPLGASPPSTRGTASPPRSCASTAKRTSGAADPALLAGAESDVGHSRPRRSAPFRSWRRGPAVAAPGTIACASPGSVFTTAVIADVARILHAGQPYTAWAGFVESANSPADVRAAGGAGGAARPSRQHHRHALPARGAGRLGGVAAALAHSRSALDARAPARRHGGPARAHPRARRRGHDQSDQLSLALRRGRGGAPGGSRGDACIPHRSLARLGIPFGLATDNKPANPWLAFNAAVDRRDMAHGRDPRRRASGSRARKPLRALTVGGARVTFAERERGVLAPGFAADLAVLDRRSADRPPRRGWRR